MSTKFFTNQDSNTLLGKFAAVFANNKQIAEFDALVGYFRSSGYFRLRPHLESLARIRILVGIDVDKWTAEAQQSGLSLQFGVGEENAIQDYTKQLEREIEEADYEADVESSILQFVEDIKTKKVVLRAHPSRKLHAKIYIFRPQTFNEHTGGEVITGSSNLTEPGLGSSHTHSNYEFNVSLRDYDDIQFATKEFENLWEESVDVLPERTEQVLHKSHLRDDFTPFEIYIKLLIEYFGKEIEFDPNSVTDLPDGWKRLNYQMDAVEQGYLMLQRHNGFFLSDVVGLGKTVIATMIARKYFYLNDYPEYRSRTLIVCPPAVKENWQKTIGDFQLDNVKIITSGSLHRVENYQQYDLVIVDEAHKFKNDDTERYAALQSVCKSPCRNGERKKVILVSATPLNNSPEEIRNLLLLFQDSNDSTLDISIIKFFIEAEKAYKEIVDLLASNNNVDVRKRVEDLYARIRRKVIEPLTVRRTRTDLMEHDEYAKDLAKQGIVFPQINPPENLLYQMDPELNSLYEESFAFIQNTGDNGLKYARYRLIEHLKPEHKKDYQRPDFFLAQLVAIVKTLLIKRLDSSFYAFHQSLLRSVKTSESTIKMFENNRIVIAPDTEIEEYILGYREEELLSRLSDDKLTDPRIKILTRDDFAPGFLELLQDDHALLSKMENQWRSVIENSPDPKLQLLLDELPKRLLDAKRNKEHKLVIFSESADTTRYLEKKLQEGYTYRVLAVSGQNRAQHQDAIRRNFDANLSTMEQKSEYDIIISTEALAEGVNLHRANSIVNYDTPWNSIRLMQRIGRINRIGSRADRIYIYNFFPTEQVEGDISLKHRAQIKLHAFHSALGEDSQIYTPDENPQTFGLFDRDTKESQVVSERLAYLMEIRRFHKENPDQFKRIKNLPLKIRNTVANEELSGNVICFLRNSRHNAFYKVNADREIKEMGFLEVAPIFKRHKDNVAKPLPESHHEQVQAALEHFKTDQQEDVVEQQVPELTQQQRIAVVYAQMFLNVGDVVNEDEKKRIQQAIEWVRLGRYQNLTKDIAKLQRSQKKTPAVVSKQLETLLGIIDKHAPSTTLEEGEVLQTVVATDKIEPPRVVISQNYQIYEGEDRS